MPSPIQGVVDDLRASQGNVTAAGDRLGAALTAWAQATSEVESAVGAWNTCASTELAGIDESIADPLRHQIALVGRQATQHISRVRESATSAKKNLASAQGQVLNHFKARIRRVETALRS